MTDSIGALAPAAFLFDMDGTLVDSTEVVERVWHEFAVRYALDADAILEVAHGVRSADTIARFLDAGAVPEAVSWHDRRELEYREGTVPIAGAPEFVRAVVNRGERAALVTSASLALAEVRMLEAGVPLPPVVVSADDISRGKPDPSGYLLAADLLGVDIADCVVFEDSQAGVLAGLASGAEVIVVGAGGFHEASGLRRIVDFRDLPLPGVG